MERVHNMHIRHLQDDDPPSIAAAFASMGWNKPERQYRRYWREQVAGSRMCFVATVDGQFASYVTVNWQPTYPGFGGTVHRQVGPRAERTKESATILVNEPVGTLHQLSGFASIYE